MRENSSRFESGGGDSLVLLYLYTQIHKSSGYTPSVMIELSDPLFAARHATQIPNDWFSGTGMVAMVYRNDCDATDVLHTLNRYIQDHRLDHRSVAGVDVLIDTRFGTTYPLHFDRGTEIPFITSVRLCGDCLSPFYIRHRNVPPGPHNGETELTRWMRLFEVAGFMCDVAEHQMVGALIPEKHWYRMQRYFEGRIPHLVNAYDITKMCVSVSPLEICRI